ncbi:hypothetical protein SDC9_178328 [bioreactor metagenome]|uniref:Uncharacterized protein n=1 Tax=bioreactor metagenome TaxID=1076179 RepID=A0A645GW14_9ZZZZ
MKQIKISIIGFKPFKLFVQIPIHVLSTRNQPAWKFGCYIDLFAVAVLECLPKNGFAHTPMIRVGSINVINTGIDGIADHLYSFFFINPSIISVYYRKPHGTETQY